MEIRQEQENLEKMETRMEARRPEPRRYYKPRAYSGPHRRRPYRPTRGKAKNPAFTFKETLLLQFIVSGVVFVCVLAACVVNFPLAASVRTNLKSAITQNITSRDVFSSAAGVIDKVKSSYGLNAGNAGKPSNAPVGAGSGNADKGGANHTATTPPVSTANAPAPSAITQQPSVQEPAGQSAADLPAQSPAANQAAAGAAPDNAAAASGGQDVNNRIDEDILNQINSAQDTYNLKNAQTPAAQAKAQPEG